MELFWTRSLLIAVLIIVTSCATTNFSTSADKEQISIEKWCSLQCPFQNKSSELKDGECGSLQCYIGQCSRGCGAWRAALLTSCQDACTTKRDVSFDTQNGTQELLPPRELYCVMGCNSALNHYFEQLRDALGTPPTPALQADTLNATSLSLDWGTESDKPPPHEPPLYRVKWRYEEVPGANWQYFRNHSWSSATSARLDNLQPYTKYRFRVAALVSRHPAAAQNVLESAPSVVIQTLAAGLPASPPTRVRATAVDSTHVSVTWAPAPFPHGPVLSYVLRLSEDRAAGMHAGYSTSKDVKAPATSYMFQNVPPASNFTLTVSTRNWLGIGPTAATRVSTPPEPEVGEDPEAVLLLATQDSIIRLSSDIIEDPVTIYNSSHDILGIAVHVRRNLLFLSDRSGQVSSISLENSPPRARLVLDGAAHDFAPHKLSVDWLNDLLYVVGEARGGRWQVVRCRLDGQGFTVAVAGLHARPLHLQVDPYNGYMFWVTEGVHAGRLHRLDLAEVSNGVRHETRPETILERVRLGAFTVDHASFRLLVADPTINSVLAVSLDGKEVSDIRRNTLQPLFNESVKSLVTANGIFYWINGSKVLSEDYHVASNSYYDYTFPQLSRRIQQFVELSVLLPAAQPTPVPVNPPSALQAVLGHDAAKLAWQPPHLLGGQGKGAWQNWSYEVQLRDETRGTVETHLNVTSTSVTLTSLRSDTRYSLKACAYTSAGRGPWSVEFRGRSFRAPLPGRREPSLVWGADEGLMQSDTTGDSVVTLIHADSLKDGSGRLHVSGVAWYDDMLFLATNASVTLWFNLTSRAQGHVQGIDSAVSIAVDWLGRRLYWSNPKQQLITRGSLDGENQEPLPILTVAKELHIDSVNAFLYWSTGHAVECARLNGQNRHIYYPSHLFSGKQVMGVTLDHERLQVFWIVRSYEGSLLYHAPMALDSAPPPINSPQGVKADVTSLMHPVVQGPLCYFSDHLLWLQDSSNAVISDLTGQSAAVISGPGLSGLNVVAVVDPAHHVNPVGEKVIIVIPSLVRQESIRLVGSWDAFNFTWAAVSNVNFGSVFYEVKIWEQNSQREISIETDVNSVQFPKTIPPYSPLEVSVRAFTYWGSSPLRSSPQKVYTPAAPPSAPASPRVYVSFTRFSPVQAAPDIDVTFRWNPPVAPNGIVEQYRVRACLEAPDEFCKEYLLDPSKLEFTAQKLLTYSNYNFQVWARTSAGEGAGSEIAYADTSAESPVPRLLVGTREALKLTDCDRLSAPKNATQVATTVVRGEPLATVAFLAADQRLFWLSSDRSDVFSCLLDGSSIYKVASLNGTGSSLSLDWIARSLYWTEHSHDAPGTTIWRLQLLQNSLTRVISRPRPVSTLHVFPLTSALYWVEENSKGEGQLMTSKLDGSNPRPFFSNNSSCSCPRNAVVGSALALDATKEKLLWSDVKHGDILAAELDGCDCNVIVNASAYSGFPASALTIDRDLVYWSGYEGQVFSAPITAAVGRENTREMAALVAPAVSALPLTGVRLLVALGTHLQPFPESECLEPQVTSGDDLIPELMVSTSHSLTLKLPGDIPREEEACKDVSLPSPHYHIYYAPQSCDSPIDGDQDTQCGPENLQYCAHQETYATEVELQKLAPFSCYTVMLAMGNYYTDFSETVRDPAVIGKPSIFQTQPGVPSEVRNVEVRLLSPWSVQVSWLPPEQLRGSMVRYEVLWSTGDEPEDGVRQRGEQPVTAEIVLPSGEISTMLEKLMPAQTYLIWVRAYSESSSQEYSESEQVEVHTLPEPRDIELIQALPYALNLSWQKGQEMTSRVQMLQVSPPGLAVVWHDVPETQSGVYVASNLLPKTVYQFRVSLQYPGALQSFTWPPDNRFTFETLGDRPSAPGTPHIQHLRQHVYQVSWEPSRDHGAPVELYLLEGRAGVSPRTVSPRSSREAPGDNVSTEPPAEEVENEWRLLYNGSDAYWIISADLSPSAKYSFRACARNAYGVSAWSQPSEVFDWTGAALRGEQPTVGIIVATAVPTLLFACMFVFLLYFCRHRRAEEKTLQVAGQVPLRPDVELATLREVPRGRSGLPLIQHTNALYTGGGNTSASGSNLAAELLLSPFTDQEVAALPHIRRDQITLTKFLGSGAFGEVFEGEARELPGGQQKIAVKSLRKGATEQEKCEFLKEAQLMSNFRHEHILQLLGVCLDNDPNFIIMELMEGGDLLSHLRTSRPLACSGELTLLDLVAMCVDVARGCRYLEELHFVHRDLACRNCLVSFEGSTRVVKIGDFGLARDIYKNDYYRKEGEGLLPVRWMAPESLMDGVFTSQSDAWAFGVLVWEILTLGQQPYPARTNLEVLHFVRGGGRLNRPTNCPDPIHQLILKCWSYCPEGRPTFKHCLEVLAALKLEMEEDETPVPIVGHYIGHASSGMDNAGFYADEFYYDSGDRPVKSDETTTFDDSLLGVTVSLPPETSSPKYLEVIVGGDEPPSASPESGYEMPRQVPASWRAPPLEFRPRALSAGCDEAPTARLTKRPSSVERLLTRISAPYSNIASSQPLLQKCGGGGGDNLSDSSGISSQLESVASGEVCTN